MYRLLAYPALCLAVCWSSNVEAQTPPIPSATVEVVSKRVLVEAAKYHQPEADTNAHAVENLKLQYGHMTLNLIKGVVVVLKVDGKAEGLYFKGTGRFSYLSTDTIEHPLIDFNLHENTKLVPTKGPAGMEVGEPLTEIVLWAGGYTLPVLGPASATLPKEEFIVADRFFNVRDEALQPLETNLLNRMPLGQLMAYRTANAPQARVVSAEITGEREHWVYTYDEARSYRESLLIQRPVSGGGVTQVAMIYVSSQPIGWTRKAPKDPDFRLAHMDVDVVATKKQFAKVTLTETLEIIRPNIRLLSFHLTSVRPGYGAVTRESLLKTEVSRVTDEKGQELSFDHRGGYLLVQVPTPLANGQKIKLKFEFEGDLLGTVGDASEYWRLTPGEGWYPEPDSAGQSFTVKARVAVEKPFVAIASAKTISRSSNETHNILEASLDKPTTWFSIAAGKYKSVEMVRNGRTVRAWGYAGISHGAEPLMKTAHGILDFYEDLFGNVPFDELNLVEVPVVGFGQAPAGMIWLTREAFDAIGDDVNRMVASQGAVGGWVNRLISHEIAHQYWGHQVKMWGEEDQWITESFAEYTSALAIRAMKKKGPGVFNAIIRDWAERAKEPSTACPIPLSNHLHIKLPTHRGYRQGLVYYKGAYLLANLHNEIGDEKFYRFLRAYQKSFAWYPPSYNQDVPELLKAITGKDYQKWFDDYFWGTGLPTWKP